MLQVLEFRKEPDQDVINLAENVLKLAKEGKIDCLVAVWEGREEQGQGVSWDVKGGCWYSQFIGALETVKSKLIARSTNVSVFEPWEK